MYAIWITNADHWSGSNIMESGEEPKKERPDPREGKGLMEQSPRFETDTQGGISVLIVFSLTTSPQAAAQIVCKRA